MAQRRPAGAAETQEPQENRQRQERIRTPQGAPWQNGIVQCFNGRLRDELLSSEIFDTLAEAKCLVHRSRMFYNNHRRIQRALVKRTPAAFAARCANSHDGWTDESDPVTVTGPQSHDGHWHAILAAEVTDPILTRGQSSDIEPERG